MDKMNSAFNLSRLQITARSKWRWWLPLVVLVIVAVNLAGLTLPKKFEAVAKVRVYEPALRNLNAQANDMLNTREPLKTLRAEITSFQFQEKVANRLNLDKGLDPRSPQYEALIQSILASVTVVINQDGWFQITYRDSDPRRAYLICNEIKDVYIANVLDYYKTVTDKNVDFLKASLETAKLKLQQAQEAVTKYKNEHINQMPDVQAQNLAQLNSRKAEKKAAERDLEGLYSALTLAKKKLEATDKEIDSMTTVRQQNQALLQAQTQKSQLEAQLKALLEKYTPEHRDVKELQRQIRLAEDAIMMAGSEQTETTATKIPNPEYQTLNDQVTEYELKIQQAQSTIAGMEKEIEELVDYSQNIPAGQQELNDLITQQGFAESQVAACMRRLEEARTAGEMERAGQGARFVTFDEPREPTAPVSPNRAKIAALSVVMAGAAGAALIVLLALLDSAVRSIEEARQLLQMPVLGVVQRITTPGDESRQNRRRRRKMVGTGVALFLIAAIVVVSLILWDKPLGQGLDAIRNVIGQR